MSAIRNIVALEDITHIHEHLVVLGASDAEKHWQFGLIARAAIIPLIRHGIKDGELISRLRHDVQDIPRVVLCPMLFIVWRNDQ